MSALRAAVRRALRRPDLSDVLAARLRAEQDETLARWAQDLTRADRRWLEGRKQRDG